MSRAKDIEAIVEQLHTSLIKEHNVGGMTDHHYVEFSNGGRTCEYKIRPPGDIFPNTYGVWKLHKPSHLSTDPVSCRSWRLVLRYIARDLFDNWPVVAREIIQKVKVE